MPACSAPAARPVGDPAEHRRVGLLDGEVVDHRDRLGADADQVVDVHRDAVDADRVERPVCSATTILVPTPSVAIAIPRFVADPQDARVVAGQVRRPATGVPVSIVPQDARRSRRPRVGLRGVDAGGGVGVAHARSLADLADAAGCADAVSAAGAGSVTAASARAVGRVRPQRADALHGGPAARRRASRRARRPTPSANGRASRGGRPRWAQPHALEHASRRRSPAARRAARARSRPAGEAARARRGERHAVARDAGHQRRRLREPERAARRRAASSRARVLRPRVGREPSPRTPATRPAAIDAGRPEPPLDRALEREADDRRRHEGERRSASDRRRRGRARRRRPRRAGAISSAAAVPACSATSKALRSSGSSSA